MFIDTYDDDDKAKEEAYYNSVRNLSLKKQELKDRIKQWIEDGLEYHDVLDLANSWDSEQEHRFLPMLVEVMVQYEFRYSKKRKRSRKAVNCV